MSYPPDAVVRPAHEHPPLQRLLADEARETVRRRAHAVAARRRLHEALLCLAADIVGTQSGGSVQDQAWISRTIEGYATDATDAAMTVLLTELADAVRAQPGGTQLLIGEAQSVRRVDFE